VATLLGFNDTTWTSSALTVPGTWGFGIRAYNAAGEEQFVRRDSLPIAGEGLIGLGKAPERDSAQTIRFICED